MEQAQRIGMAIRAFLIAGVFVARFKAEQQTEDSFNEIALPVWHQICEHRRSYEICAIENLHKPRTAMLFALLNANSWLLATFNLLLHPSVANLESLTAVRTELELHLFNLVKPVLSTAEYIVNIITTALSAITPTPTDNFGACGTIASLTIGIPMSLIVLIFANYVVQEVVAAVLWPFNKMIQFVLDFFFWPSVYLSGLYEIWDYLGFGAE